MRMKHILTLTTLTLGLLQLAPSASAAVGTLSKPYSHRNLQIFLVHGESTLENRRYATLSEALEKGLVVVKETGNVQELTIENVSGSATVFLNTGDIVKGGRQDRTVREDLILPPKSGPVPLSTFCVEQGRWTGRTGENSAAFSANNKILSSRSLKMAARYGQNQSEVWSGVAEQQQKLNNNLSRMTGKSVDTRSSASASSLQLSLESKDLASVTKGYLDALKPLLDGKTDVIGFAFAINGEINSAEIYNNKNLFRALWPKLLESAITEAIAEAREGDLPKVEARQVGAFFATALEGTTTERQVWKTTRVVSLSTPNTVMFETIDIDASNTWIHKSFVNKGRETVTVPLDSNFQSQTPQIRR